MQTLDQMHPANLLVGFARVGQQIAAKLRQSTLGVYFQSSEKYALENRELVREIATDTEYADDRAVAIAADGKITTAELAELRALLREIREEAITGKIISSR